MSIKDSLKDAGQSVAGAAKQATDWVKDKTGLGEDERADGIRERMEVIGSCGNKLGVIDHIEGGQLKLTRGDSADGMHHLIPLTWVDHVDSRVHLSKDCGEARRDWQSVA